MKYFYVIIGILSIVHSTNAQIIDGKQKMEDVKEFVVWIDSSGGDDVTFEIFNKDSTEQLFKTPGFCYNFDLDLLNDTTILVQSSSIDLVALPYSEIVIMQLIYSNGQKVLYKPKVMVSKKYIKETIRLCRKIPRKLTERGDLSIQLLSRLWICAYNGDRRCERYLLDFEKKVVPLYGYEGFVYSNLRSLYGFVMEKPIF